jgi:hypothetical protein
MHREQKKERKKEMSWAGTGRYGRVTRKPSANHLRKRAPNAELDKIDAADTTDAQFGAKTKNIK